MKKVAIINYGMGNLDSVKRGVEECGGFPVITDQPAEIEASDCIILPGVGSFGEGMFNLRQRGLDRILAEQVRGRNVPFLGICLGMQMLATEGFEGGKTAGLGWIEGVVRKLEPGTPPARIPHVGWNEVSFSDGCPLFKGMAQNKDFYFVHSFHLECREASDVSATTPYCGGFVSAIWKDNIFAVQFHPEKSQKPGFALLKNFLAV